MKIILIIIGAAIILLIFLIPLNASASSDPADNPQQYINGQEIIDINDYLVYFYWGRHPEHEDFDGRLGGGTFAIYKGDKAIVVDTGNLPGQGKWVRKKLQSAYGIKNFTFRHLP